MAVTVAPDVNRIVTQVPHRLRSLLASFAVALTFFRFSAARIQADRDAGTCPHH